jgi:hypothetical protein
VQSFIVSSSQAWQRADEGELQRGHGRSKWTGVDDEQLLLSHLEALRCCCDGLGSRHEAVAELFSGALAKLDSAASELAD